MEDCRVSRLAFEPDVWNSFGKFMKFRVWNPMYKIQYMKSSAWNKMKPNEIHTWMFHFKPLFSVASVWSPLSAGFGAINSRLPFWTERCERRRWLPNPADCRIAGEPSADSRLNLSPAFIFKQSNTRAHPAGWSCDRQSWLDAFLPNNNFSSSN